ncbi:phosphodiester glycosidase family protein [Sphingobacterium faecale]|uniref:Phosphodiester glycosidase family protein n=1 Tax=Sphingobacterium faecale TaxID=2803775 RepID=A0ABS1R0S3_9SPHI|nr:phosphodiester glycosidase family protein [Sphingobacterium faecale]MBL1408278.1 phosphodiester glycosidase family protein [Sphingobacterium faecale]
MKMIYIQKALLATMFGLVLTVLSCSNKEEFIRVEDTYSLVPTSDVGKKIVEQTDLMVHIHQDSAYQITDGVTATEISYISKTGLAKKIFVIETDLANPKIGVEVSTPKNSAQFGMQPMTIQATFEDYEGHKVWAGINADFYNMTNGTPQGIVYKEGVAIKTTVTDQVNTFFAILKNGKAFVGNQTDYAQVRNEIQEAVGGRVTLVSDGILQAQTSDVLEPRTAIGVSQDGYKVYMLVVDGRRFHYSNGMSYEELGKCLKALGAYDAINLDGGGSSTYFKRSTADFSIDRFQLRNWPSDNGGAERAVANGLLLIAK